MALLVQQGNQEPKDNRARKEIKEPPEILVLLEILDPEVMMEPRVNQELREVRGRAGLLVQQGLRVLRVLKDNQDQLEKQDLKDRVDQQVDQDRLGHRDNLDVMVTQGL